MFKPVIKKYLKEYIDSFGIRGPMKEFQILKKPQIP